jgi:hypothetical protein
MSRTKSGTITVPLSTSIIRHHLISGRPNSKTEMIGTILFDIASRPCKLKIPRPMNNYTSLGFFAGVLGFSTELGFGTGV